MRTLALAMALATAPLAAGACSMVEPTRAETWRGPSCVVRYSDTKAPQYVASSEAVDLGHGIVRQVFANGACGMGERVVAYFDCASRTGAWLGGPVTGEGAPPVPMVDGVPAVSPFGYGLADQFIQVEEKRLAHGPRPADVLKRVRALAPDAQAGAIESPRMSVDGKRFDLNCGCALFYPNGVK